MTQHHHLLVVRAAGPHPHVEQALAARLLDLRAEAAVLLLAEPETVQVGAPQQALHDDVPAGRLAQHRADLGALTGEPLVAIAAPVGEQEQVT
ncbi:hypothetical protein ACWCQ0_50385, partial [Streptomyces massasporeus]